MKLPQVWKIWTAVAVLLVVSVGGLIVSKQRGRVKTAAVVFTVGDLRAVHADVWVGERDVAGERRISDGETVRTGPDGRARVRLDDGTIVAVDGETRFSLHGNTLTLETGRIFVQGGSAAQVKLGQASTTVSSSAVAFEKKPSDAWSAYCAQGEFVIAVSDRQTRVTSGETATFDGQAINVAPEKAFNDWTGGLAVPWSSPLGEKSAIPELRTQFSRDDPGTPLVIRSHAVDVDLDGELALTRTRTIYFNGSSGVPNGTIRLALPHGAILKRVAYRKRADVHEAKVLPLSPDGARSTVYGLEWAGGGWLSGNLPAIESGDTLELLLEYAEWISTASGRLTYRYPMAAPGGSSLVGELNARVDLSRTSTPFVSASAGATFEESRVQLRQADARPTGDLVVEYAPTLVRDGVARAYVMDGADGEDRYVMVRTEVPDRKDPGVTLAVVVDTSMSLGASTLETARAVVDALLEGLGPRDSLVVLAADQTVRPLGPATPEAVTPELRKTVRAALGAVRPGGASNLGLALQHAADLLDSPARGEHAGAGMLVYVGDGRPTTGEPDATSIRRLIGRRPAGLPRLAAVALGSDADRWTLARLVAGAGDVYEVVDRADAARAGATLLADALRPTLRDVELDLGPNVDRIYPREARSVLAGSTVSVLGRLRGNLPPRVGFRFRDGLQLITESRPLERLTSPSAADVPQRWASARIEDTAARDEGIEPAIALAKQAHLLTPWTAWVFPLYDEPRSTMALGLRILEVSPSHDAPFAAYLDDLKPGGAALLEPQQRPGGGVSLQQAGAIATRRILQQAANAVRACRDARASVRPDVGRLFTIDLAIDGKGLATRVHVELNEVRGGDPVLQRCIEGVVRSLPFFALGTPVTLRHQLVVPESPSSRRTQCSEASRVALPLRRMIWHARSDSVPLNAEAYLSAARYCELPFWTDRRAFLLLVIEKTPDSEQRLDVAAALETAGETDAAAFVRRETLRRVTSFSELERLNALLMQDEPEIDAEFDKAYLKATTDAERLTVVRHFLRLAPHNVLARRRLLTLLEAMGHKDALVAEIAHLRAEPIANAGLLAQAASALRRVGLDAEGRRSFGELIERAPNDPWTLAFVGDRLRAEGLFDEARVTYETLARALPDDAAVTSRLALAHAGAGRLDVATRLLERVTQTGGRGDDGRLGELASIVQAVLLAGAQGNGDAEVEAELQRRLLRTPLPDAAGFMLVQVPPADSPVEVSFTREHGEKAAQSPDFDAPALGVAALRVERGSGETRLLLKRAFEPGPLQETKVRVAALASNDDGTRRLLVKEVTVAADGKPVELRFTGESLL